MPTILKHGDDLWKKAIVPTEEATYRHMVAKAYRAKWLYFAIPWASLIELRRRRYAIRLDCRRGIPVRFTTCQHIHWPTVIPACKQLGVTDLFTPHADARREIDGIKIHPHPHFSVITEAPVASKDILFSFVGASTHPVREHIFGLQGGYIVRRPGVWHFGLVYPGRPPKIRSAESRAAEEKEYRDVMSRSIFSLCPRGTGPSSIRLWESLYAGAIPIVLADDLRLPTEMERCCLRIPEQDIQEIPRILSSIPSNEIEARRCRCLKLATQLENDFTCLMDQYIQ